MAGVLGCWRLCCPAGVAPGQVVLMLPVGVGLEDVLHDWGRDRLGDVSMLVDVERHEEDLQDQGAGGIVCVLVEVCR